MVKFILKLSTELLEQIKEYARIQSVREKKTVSASEVMRRALVEYLDRHELIGDEEAQS